MIVPPKDNRFLAGSFLRLLEILQIRRRLVLLRRHKEAGLADIIVLLADLYMMVAVGALRFEPHRLRLGGPAVLLVGGERAGQRMVMHGDVVVQEVGIGLV